MLSPSSELTCLRCTMSPLLPSSTIGTSFCSFPRASWVEGCKRNKCKKNEFAKNIICLNWLPQLSNIVEAGPAETLWITFKIMGALSKFFTRLNECLETSSDEPMNWNRVFNIKVRVFIIKVRLFNRVEAGKYIWKKLPKKNWDVKLVNRNCF